MNTLAQLNHLSQITPRFTSGDFLLPFGPISYVDACTLEIQYREIFEQRIYDCEDIAPQGTILDCGANIGLSLIRYAKCHPDCDIYGYEADPSIAAVCVANIARLGLKRVNVIPLAVTDRNGTSSFQAEGGEGGRLSCDGNIEVTTVRLLDLLKNRDVELLKLDIEGAEWACLVDVCRNNGLSRTRRLIVEFHGTHENTSTFGYILSELSRAGFQFTFPWSFCEPGLSGPRETTPFPFAVDGKFILFLHAWRCSK